jgi:DnaK suppressor protein
VTQERHMTEAAIRQADLKHILSARRGEIERDVHGRIRDGRTDRLSDVRDIVEHSDAGIQGDIELALLQMRAETLIRIDEALVRLDAGANGACAECGREISEGRLRALPFAVRCQPCEERRERRQERSRQRAHRDTFSLFSDVVDS